MKNIFFIRYIQFRFSQHYRLEKYPYRIFEYLKCSKKLTLFNQPVRKALSQCLNYRVVSRVRFNICKNYCCKIIFSNYNPRTVIRIPLRTKTASNTGLFSKFVLNEILTSHPRKFLARSPVFFAFLTLTTNPNDNSGII